MSRECHPCAARYQSQEPNETVNGPERDRLMNSPVEAGQDGVVGERASSALHLPPGVPELAE